MPAVQSGNVLKVDAILNSLKGGQTNNQDAGGKINGTCTLAFGLLEFQL